MSQSQSQFSRMCLMAALLFGLLWLAMLVSGCKFYEFSGSKTTVGDITTPVEVTEPTDTLTVKLLYSMTGASVWSEKGSKVAVSYTNEYTNTYLWAIQKEGRQQLTVEVVPKTEKENPAD